MNLSTSALRSYIQGIQFSDPKLYSVLMALVDRFQATEADLVDIRASIAAEITETVSEAVPQVEIFEYEFYPDYINLTWEQPDSSIVNYEIRLGSDWDTAARILVTNTLSADVAPLTVGTHTYLIKSINTAGLYSVNAKSLNVIVPAIPAPSVLSNVVDNNVLLYWVAPTSSFRILHYIIKKDDVEIGTKDGTFTTVFERASGTYKYSIIAVDIAGNYSASADRYVSVKQPPDYILKAVQTDDLSGTKVRTYLYSSRLVCNYVSETWEDHFISRGWATIQDQIDAGYPIYLQPTAGTGTYQQTFDFGSIITNTIINLNWTVETIDGSMNITASTETSEDAVSWDAPVVGTSIYASSVRYARVTITFTANS